MSNVWFTADTHFGHRAMAATGKGWRPFATVEEHDEHLIEAWNKVVKADDQVWHLGDVGMGTQDFVLETVKRLNGHKHLIAGNHDKVWSGTRDGYKHMGFWMQYFDSVQSFARRRIDRNQNFMLSHFPYEGDHVAQERYGQYRLRDEGLWLAHGHVHTEWAQRGRQVNVGVDVRDWAPMHLDELVEIFRSTRATTDRRSA
jgi:calcineurin-like phosphoesterase family protein